MKKKYLIMAILLFVGITINAQQISDYVTFSYQNGIVSITKLPTATAYTITCEHYINANLENTYTITATTTSINLIPMTGTSEFYFNVQIYSDDEYLDDSQPLRLGPATVDDIDAKILTLNPDALSIYIQSSCDVNNKYDYIGTVNSIPIDKQCFCSFVNEMLINPTVLDLYNQQYVWEAFYDEWSLAILANDMIDYCMSKSIPYKLAKANVDESLKTNEYHIYDLMGNEIDKSINLSSGIYILKENSNGDIKTYKYIVQ